MTKVQDEAKAAKQRAHEERERVADETMTALAETGCRKNEAWWQVYYLLSALGSVVVALLVGKATEVHAGAGMMVADGTRKRTLGGVFFQLAREQAGLKAWRRTVTIAAHTWARRWLRKLDAEGTRPATPEELRAALAAHGDVATTLGERVFFELAAKRDPVAEVMEREGIEANLCQTQATTPQSRVALAGVLAAAAKHVREHPDRFRPKTEPPPARPRPVQGRGPVRRQVVMPPVEVIARTRRGP